ncbi:MAG: hypothetical protein VX280_08415 [Bacteroidota bacterium]|nr:hypothetical protein [Bacteroidota bacterium]
MRVLIIFLFLVNSIFAQTQNEQIKTSLNKNSLSFNIGTAILANGLGLKYERIIARKQLYYSISANVNFFRFSFFGAENHTVLSVSNGFITGIDERNHFDANVGLGWDYVNVESYGGIYGSGGSPASQYNQFLPVASFGYRYQVPNDGFIFRTGVGYPELLYISFGVSF